MTILSQQGAVDEWDRAHDGNPRPEDWYVDEGWSGFILERPALDRLRDAAADPARDWNELLVYDPSRLSRDAFHREYILEAELAKLGVTVIYVASPVFPDTAEGHAMKGMSGVFDRFFAEKARENMRRGLHYWVKQGQCWWAPYGYRVTRHVPEDGGRTVYTVAIFEPEAVVFRELVARVIAGESASAIARDLNARGVASARGAGWSGPVICQMLHSPYYTGTAVWGQTHFVEPKNKRASSPEYRRRRKTSSEQRDESEWIGRRDVPPLMTPDEQERALTALALHKVRSVAHPRHLYQLRNLLCCKEPLPDDSGPCNRRLIARTVTRKSGLECGYYRCGRVFSAARQGERRGCGTTVNAAAVEALVWDHVVHAITHTADLHAAYEQALRRPAVLRARWQEALTRLGSERDESERDLRAAQRLLERGVYDEQEYAVAKRDIVPRLRSQEEQIEHAQEQLAQIREVGVQWEDLAALCQQLHAAAQGADAETRARIMQRVVRSVDVYHDRFEVNIELGAESAQATSPRYQLKAEGRARCELVTCRITAARLIGGQQQLEHLGQARYAVVFGQGDVTDHDAA